MLINLGFFAKESHPKRNNEIFTAFMTFAKIGMFTIGGGYAMIPLIERGNRKRDG